MTDWKRPSREPELLRACKQRQLPRRPLQYHQRETEKGVQLLLRVPGVPRDALFFDVVHAHRRLQVSGVHFARQPLMSRRGGFGLSGGYVPVSWFEETLDISPTIDLRNRLTLSWLDEETVMLWLPYVKAAGQCRRAATATEHTRIVAPHTHHCPRQPFGFFSADPFFFGGCARA